MASPNPSLSVVLLVFNEQETLLQVLDEHRAFLEWALDDWEIIVVDDGSSDASADIARGFAVEHENVRVVVHGANKGMGAGMSTGVRHAANSHLVFNAADGQIPAVEIAKLLPLLDTADIALSTYGERRDGPVRALLSKGLRAYMRQVGRIRFELEGLYLFPTATAKELEPQIRARTFFFSFELIQRGIERGLTTATTEIRVQPRESGSSKVANLRRILRVAGDILSFGISRRIEACDDTE